MNEFIARWRYKGADVCLAGCLLLLIFGVYAPVRHFAYINYDDPVYVTLNRHVTEGLTKDSLRWAFTSGADANWFPTTWISLMAVRQFFGPGPGPQHVFNVVIHAASALILFALLKRLTGTRLPSALVAFLFALHPQHVQSVAWVTERKDVLSALFWMLALCSYAVYVATRRWGAYLLTLLLYCLGLMAKPMVVTLPLVLILMDLWPLGRVSTATPRTIFARQGVRTLIWDKLPFFVLSMVVSAVTYYVQQSGEAVRPLDEWPPSRRLANAVVSAATYIAKLVWPSHLAVYYPSHPPPRVWQVAAAACLLVALTAVAVLAIRTRPYLAVGWFWYVITILPVIGIVQVGEQSRADRYTYIPGIGLSIMLAWSFANVYEWWPKGRPVLMGLGIAAGVACLLATSKQISYWQNSRTLFQHAIEVTQDNEIAHGCLGEALRAEGRYQDALAEYRMALAIDPRYVAALINYGSVLGTLGRLDEAMVPLKTAIRLKRDDPDAHHALGLALALQGHLQEAYTQFETAVLLNPDSVSAHTDLGKTLGNLGRIDDAIAQFSEALRLQPDAVEARAGLEKALSIKHPRQN